VEPEESVVFLVISSEHLGFFIKMAGLSSRLTFLDNSARLARFGTGMPTLAAYKKLGKSPVSPIQFVERTWPVSWWSAPNGVMKVKGK
jgi:hypothetical protein